MNDQTVVSNASEDRRQEALATGYAFRRLLNDATAFGKLLCVPTEVESYIEHALNGHLVSATPLLRAVTNKLIGHPEYWGDSDRDSQRTTVVLEPPASKETTPVPGESRASIEAR